jgi:hypothetical protein
MIEVVAEEMHRMRRTDCPDRKRWRASLGWWGSSSTKAKWRAPPEWMGWCTAKVLDAPDVFREAGLQKLSSIWSELEC